MNQVSEEKTEVKDNKQQNEQRRTDTRRDEQNERRRQLCSIGKATQSPEEKDKISAKRRDRYNSATKIGCFVAQQQSFSSRSNNQAASSCRSCCVVVVVLSFWSASAESDVAPQDTWCNGRKKSRYVYIIIFDKNN